MEVMKSAKLFFLSFLFMIKPNDVILKNNVSEDRLALVINPVIDLVGDQKNDIDIYYNIPLSPVDKKDRVSCPRLHQLLFNTIVKIVNEDDNGEVTIIIPNVFHQIENKIKISTYRTLRKNLAIIDELQIDLNKIPEPIDYKKNKTIYKKTISLKYPFYDPKTKRTYSAGTRFIYNKNDDNKYYAYIYNPKLNKFERSEIPKELCFNNSIKLELPLKIAKYVKLVKKWANSKKGSIPYVWGGNNYITTCDQTEFNEKKVNRNDVELHFYENPECKINPKSGFDCSGLVVASTQICGLPFYFKNSTTIAQNLRSLRRNERISNGDLIWLPGHIIIISDIKNNLIVEATDYSTGYGKIHETKVGKIFKGIDNFQILKKIFFSDGKLERLNSKGNPYQIIYKFKILKINSIIDK